MRLILALLLFIPGFFINSLTVDAASHTVVIEGKESGLINITSHTFLECIDMMPGYKEEGMIHIENQTNRSFYVYLMAQKLTDNIEDDILNHLDLTVRHNQDIIYQGSVSEHDILTDAIYLGEFKADTVTELQAQVYLDGELSLKNFPEQYHEIEWKFVALRDKATSEDTPSEGVNQPSSPESGDLDSITFNPNHPQTGYQSLGLMIGSIVIVIGLLISIFQYRKKDK